MKPLPTDFFPGYTADVTGITLIPYADTPGLTEPEANASTGDGREVLRTLLEGAYKKFIALTSPPTKMTFTKATADVSTDVIRQTYTVSFVMDFNNSDSEIQTET